MDDRRQDQHSTTLEPLDEFVVEPLPPGPRLPRSPGTRVLLGVLAALLVVTVVGTTVLVVRGLRTQASQATSEMSSARATATVPPTATVPSATPTPAPEPKDYGWTQVTRLAGDVKFSASDAQRGYLCGMDQSGRFIVGVTTNGGQVWMFGPAPAAFESCSIQISPTNPLDVVVTSQEGTCAAPCPHFDAHYSTDGGNTWKAAPIPQTTIVPGGALWSAAYLYVWSGVNKDSGQSAFLKVSAYGGPFASLDLHALLPGAQNVSIQSAVAGGTKLYVNIGYSGCSSQNCQAIVASGDGGKTWTQVPNQSSIQLVYVMGNTLYGWMTDPHDPSTLIVMRSTDGGTTWMPLTFPPLPDGQTLNLSHQVSWVPTPDGTVFMASPDLGVVAYLRAGAWTVIPFGPHDLNAVTTVSLDANGHPQRVWELIDAQSSRRGIYWHALP